MSQTHTKTYVLVHGAWHGGRVWDRVVPLLTRAGHRAFAPSLTGHGEKEHLLTPEVDLDTHIADIVALLDERNLTDVVLVGHSYAGMVISGAAGAIPDRIAHLVYVDAMVPSDGESALDVRPEVTQRLIDAAAASDTPWRIPPIPEMPAPLGLFGVTDPADVAWLRPMLADESVRCFVQPVRLDNPAVDTIPRTHIHFVGTASGDTTRRPVPAVPPGGVTSQVWELHSGHDCMVTVPDALTDLLLKTG